MINPYAFAAVKGVEALANYGKLKAQKGAKTARKSCVIQCHSLR